MENPASSPARQADASHLVLTREGDDRGAEDRPEGCATEGQESQYEVSVIVVSFDARGLLRECLRTAIDECMRLPGGMRSEVLVVGNGASDAAVVNATREVAVSRIRVRHLRSEVKLRLAEAHNLAMGAAAGRYIVLLDPDAFLHAGALRKAILHMDANHAVGIGGARLVGRDGVRRPFAHSFPALWRDALCLTGLAEHLPGWRICDGAWACPEQPAQVDWVPEAFSILRPEALKKSGLFDPVFSDFYHQADLGRRVKAAGYRIQYWPDLVLTYTGGDAGMRMHSLDYGEAGAEVVLERMRSTLLYYRKHHGRQARLALWLEHAVYLLRRLRNGAGSDPASRQRAGEARVLQRLMMRAWKETEGGRVSPPRQ